MDEPFDFGDYTLLGRLARGGMAEVFLAKSKKPELDGVLFALKRTLPELWKDQEFVAMFRDEARLAQVLSHANICKLYEVGDIDHQLFLAMEFVHGKDLRVVQQRARERSELVPYRYTAYLVAKIADCLHAAHECQSPDGEPLGIVHRDVSPQNILLSYEGVPKLIDFGVAKAKGRLAQTQVGILKGKFSYMAPEQVTGLNVDRRADVFSLGIVLYELCTGRSTFRGGNDFSTLQRVADARYVAPRQLSPDIPRRLAAVIDKALRKEASQRYPTTAAMAKDLDDYLREESKAITPATLSAYMRKLFRQEYSDEQARIRIFLVDPTVDFESSTVPQLSPFEDSEMRSTDQGGGDAHHEGSSLGRTGPDDPSDQTGIAPSYSTGKISIEAPLPPENLAIADAEIPHHAIDASLAQAATGNISVANPWNDEGSRTVQTPLAVEAFANYDNEPAPQVRPTRRRPAEPLPAPVAPKKASAGPAPSAWFARSDWLILAGAAAIGLAVVAGVWLYARHALGH